MITKFAKEEKIRLDDFTVKYDKLRLIDEFNQRKYLPGYKKSDKGQSSDQYETTQEVKERIAKLYRLKKEDIWDPFPFNPGFRKNWFFDAAVELWPLNKIICTNWPYSISSILLIKAC